MFTRRRKIALHEICHGTAAAALGGRVEYITVIPHCGMLAHAHIVMPERVERAVAVWLAGPVCDQKTDDRIGWLQPRENDVPETIDYINSLYHGPVDHRQTSEWQEGEQLARQHVAKYWELITYMANWLEGRPTMRGPLVHRMVNDFQMEISR